MYVRPLSNVSSVSRTQLIDFHVHCLSVGFTLDVTILRDDVVLICNLNHTYLWMTQLFHTQTVTTDC